MGCLEGLIAGDGKIWIVEECDFGIQGFLCAFPAVTAMRLPPLVLTLVSIIPIFFRKCPLHSALCSACCYPSSEILSLT